MKNRLIQLLASILVVLLIVSCEKTEISPACILSKFVTFTPSTNISHTDQIIMKEGKIDRVVSFDYRHVQKDTINRRAMIYFRNQSGLVSQIRDEMPGKLSFTYDFEHDNNGNPIKSVEKLEGNLRAINDILYTKNFLISVKTLSLVGINRDLNYDAEGNPVDLIRYDTTPFSSYKHEFDNKNNFFAGIPEIKYLWIARPIFNFLPFGKNNIKSVRVFTLQGTSLTEEPSLKSTRLLEYNDQGFPTKITRLNDSNNSAVISETIFEYNCK